MFNAFCVKSSWPWRMEAWFEREDFSLTIFFTLALWTRGSEQSSMGHSHSSQYISPLLLSARFVLRSDPEPWDSDPRLVRVDQAERLSVAVLDMTDPRGQVDDSRLPEEYELVSDP